MVKLKTLTCHGEIPIWLDKKKLWLQHEDDESPTEQQHMSFQIDKSHFTSPARHKQVI